MQGYRTSGAQVQAHFAGFENRRPKGYAGSSPIPSAIPQSFPFHFDKMLWQ